MGDPRCFDYHRAVAPLTWVLIAIASIEVVVTHVVIALLWNRTGALLISALTLAGIGWIVAVLAPMRRLPVLLYPDRLVMRVGRLKQVSVPVDNIAGLRPAFDAQALKRRDMLVLSLVAYPNIVVDLKQPLPGRRGIRAIAHRLDDPMGFAAALEPLIARHDRRSAGPA